MIRNTKVQFKIITNNTFLKINAKKNTTYRLLKICRIAK
jgi:hypothetical protein